jgi:hypothetical protein
VILFELADSVARCFDQFATVAFASATRTHAEDVQVKLRRFGFSGDRIVGITGLLGGRPLQRYIQFPRLGAVIKDSHADRLPFFSNTSAF